MNFVTQSFFPLVLFGFPQHQFYHLLYPPYVFITFVLSPSWAYPSACINMSWPVVESTTLPVGWQDDAVSAGVWKQFKSLARASVRLLYSSKLASTSIKPLDEFTTSKMVGVSCYKCDDEYESQVKLEGYLDRIQGPYVAYHNTVVGSSAFLKLPRELRLEIFNDM